MDEGRNLLGLQRGLILELRAKRRLRNAQEKSYLHFPFKGIAGKNRPSIRLSCTQSKPVPLSYIVNIFEDARHWIGLLQFN
jgi:hypothetical protein